MSTHPDPVTAKLLADDPEAAAAYERLQPRYEFIGAVIEARHKRGWTQKDLASRIGTTQSAVARLERGDQDPRLSTMIAVCHALNLPFTIGKDFRQAG
jgi:DNA-binding XRE family transcriptional regulator